MESFNLNIQLNEEQKRYREECISFCMNNSYVLQFLEDNDLDINFVKNNSSKLKRWAENKCVCEKCNGLEECKFYQGRYFEIQLMDNFLEQVYAKCDYFKQEESKNEYLKNYVLYHGSEDMKLRTFKMVDLNREDKKEVVDICNELIKSENDQKGIYLCGKPGIGKTFFLNCMGNFYVKKGMKVAFVNSPTLMSDLKNNFNVSGYTEEVLSKLKKCDVLIFDDLGGESISAWNRDEILMPLFNERMEKRLKTYFTSNYNFEQLEEHFSIDSRGHVDRIKASRLMERIKAVSSEKTIKGVNRRL